MKKRKEIVVKSIDNLGRIVIPKDYRKLYHLDKEVDIIGTEYGLLISAPKFKSSEKCKGAENENRN